MRAGRPKHVWSFDFQFDQTVDGPVLKLLNIIDEFTREALVMLVARNITADDVVQALDRVVAERGTPEHLRMDNGPEMTAHALRQWSETSGTATVFIDPGAPWQNPFVESFHSRLRDEFLAVEEFSCLIEAEVLLADRQEDYNQRRPHSALGMLAPAVFAASWKPDQMPVAATGPPSGWRARGHCRYGTRSARACATTAAVLSEALPTVPTVISTTRSHSWWTDKRGPLARPPSGALYEKRENPA